MTTTTDHAKVCTVIKAITGNEPFVRTDYGNWDGDRYVGFAALVEIPGFTLIVPGKTELEAACELLAMLRKEFPEKAAEVSRLDECAEGMAVYATYAEAKADAALARTAAILSDMRTPVRGADLSPAVAAE